jgi:hypothetical protein
MTQDGRMQGLDDEASADGLTFVELLHRWGLGNVSREQIWMIDVIASRPLQMRLAVWEGHPERAKGISQPDQGRRRCWIGRSHRREAEFRCTVLRWG